jgi:hypothetical protein
MFGTAMLSHDLTRFPEESRMIAVEKAVRFSYWVIPIRSDEK